MQEVYLDNSATTPLYQEVIDYMSSVQAKFYGNPSSLHRKGIEAEKEINFARGELSRVIGVNPGEIIFTSGGTESNNLAIRGTAYRHHRRGKHLITTPLEHPSALNSFRQLAQEGYEISYLDIDEKGNVDLNKLEALLGPETTLVSVAHVNNEIGTIQDVSQIGKIIKNKAPQALFHVDAVQSLGKVEIKAPENNIDLLSVSAHKIHGPKGTGALYVKEGTLLQPLFYGGDQEKDLRPGTENTAGIAGFGKAVSIYFKHKQTYVENMSELKKLLFNSLQNYQELYINGPSLEQGAPHILNLLFPHIKGEILLHSLEDKGIYISSGSACHSRRPEPSHVLTSLGLDATQADSSLRFSFSSLNTREEVDYAAQKVVECIEELKHFMK